MVRSWTGAARLAATRGSCRGCAPEVTVLLTRLLEMDTEAMELRHESAGKSLSCGRVAKGAGREGRAGVRGPWEGSARRARGGPLCSSDCTYEGGRPTR
jgi:hypothetical protein